MNAIKESKKWIQYLLYTILFCLVAAIIYAPFWQNGKSFIWMVDGWSQHYKAMLYYRQWVLTILDNIFVKHVFEIPMFSFSIGYGSDILTTLNYYIIGDPLGLLAVLTPEEYMVYCYNFLFVFRIYLAGAAFIAFCHKRGRYNCGGLLFGTFSYIFCGYVLYGVIRHPFFANPMIYFPLLLIGVERVLQDKKPGFLIGITAVAAISNFYFLYMLAIMTGLYTVCRVLGLKWKKGVAELLKVAGCGLTGVMVGGAVFVPVALAYFGDNRIGVKTACDVLWNADYYRILWQNFSAYRLQEDYGMLGLTMLGTLVVCSWMLRRKKEDAGQKLLLCVWLLFLVFPVFGKIMNGFSYTTNRYVWAVNLLLAYAMVAEWENFLTMGKKEFKQYGCILAGYVVLCLASGITITESMGKNILLAVIVVLFLGAGIRWKCLKKYRGLAVLMGLILSVYNNGNWAYSIKGEYDARLFVTYDMLQNGYGTNETPVVRAVSEKEEGLNRYTAGSVTFNSTLQSGLCSTQYFWSLSNPYVTRFLKEMAVRENAGIHRYTDLDERMIPNNLLCVRYYADKKDNKNAFVPYGYDKITEEEGFCVYRSELALPVCYTYDGYVSRKEYDSMNPIQRQEAITMGVVLEDGDVQKVKDFVKEKEISFSGVSYPYEMVADSSQIQVEEGKLHVLKTGATLELKFQGISGAENYFYIEGLFFQEETETSKLESVAVKVFTGEEAHQKSKTINYSTEQYIYYQDKHDFVVNLGYEQEPMEEIRLVFSAPGTYSFDTICVIGQPMESVEKNLGKLVNDVPKDVELHNDNRAFATNAVSGEMELEEDKILVFAIPYSKGWSAYVDGERTEIMRANTMCMALALPEGKHRIRLEYETYGLKAGCGISLLGILLWLLAAGFSKKLKKTETLHETKFS